MHETRELKDILLVCNMVSQITHLFNIIEEHGLLLTILFKTSSYRAGRFLLEGSLRSLYAFSKRKI